MRLLVLLLSLLASGSLGAHQVQRRPAGRIVGGWYVDISEIPFQVALTSVNAAGNFGLSCGGSLITSRHVLSAAHCLPNAPDVPLRYIRAGSSYVNEGGIISQVVTAVNHPDYNPRNLDMDINVVMLSTPIASNGITITYASIGNPASVLPDGYVVSTSGWGRQWSGGPLPDQLMRVDLPLINWQICHDRYEEKHHMDLPYFWSPYREVTPNMICAGYLDVGGLDACQGDSGGPLFIGSAVYGVVSWGFGCAHYYWPGVWAAVAPFAYWVQEVVEST